MTPIKKFNPPNKLAKLALQPGGIRAAQAVQQAQSNIDETRESYLEVLDAKVQDISDAATQSPIDCDHVHRLANEIYSEAGAYGLKELSAVAHNLCVIVSEDDVAKLPAVIKVHVDSLRALRRPELSASAAAREAVVIGLRDMTSKLLASRAS